MKKLLKTFFALVLSLTLCVPAFAGELSDRLYEVIHLKGAFEMFESSPADIQIFVDFEEFYPTDANGEYVPPFIENGSTYVPLRALAEAFDLSVSWEQETKTVYIGEKGGAPVLSDNINIYIDGKEFEARDAAGNRVYPILKEGTTYMPLRAIGEALGKNVFWDNVIRVVYVTTPASAENMAQIKSIIANTRAQDLSLELTAADSAKSAESDINASVKSYLSYFLTDDMLSSCVITGDSDHEWYYTTLLTPDELCSLIGFDKTLLSFVEFGNAIVGAYFEDGKITSEALIVFYRENDETNVFAITVEPEEN